MPRFLIALLVAFGIAAVWRRKELRNDTDRASKAIVNAASTARSRMGGVDDEADTADGDAGDAGDAGVAGVAESGDDAPAEVPEVASGD